MVNTILNTNCLFSLLCVSCEAATRRISNTNLRTQSSDSVQRNAARVYCLPFCVLLEHAHSRSTCRTCRYTVLATVLCPVSSVIHHTPLQLDVTVLTTFELYYVSCNRTRCIQICWTEGKEGKCSDIYSLQC